jgi:hypothetical protein
LPPIVQPLPAQRAADGPKVIDDLRHRQFALKACSSDKVAPLGTPRVVTAVTPRQSVTAFATGAPLRDGVSPLQSAFAFRYVDRVLGSKNRLLRVPDACVRRKPRIADVTSRMFCDVDRRPGWASAMPHRSGGVNGNALSFVIVSTPMATLSCGASQ